MNITFSKESLDSILHSRLDIIGIMIIGIIIIYLIIDIRKKK